MQLHLVLQTFISPLSLQMLSGVDSPYASIWRYGMTSCNCIEVMPCTAHNDLEAALHGLSHKSELTDAWPCR